MQIDSTSRNNEDVDSLFISLEDVTNPIEIVIHVFMLKEGWDVNNLYTICPLNAANSAVLIEQTIGRGLRLPFNAERTDIDKLDRLTIVAHDNYDSILNEAKNPNSILNKTKLIEILVNPNEPKQIPVEVVTSINKKIEDEKAIIEKSNDVNKQQKLNQLDAKRIIINYLPTTALNSEVKNIDDAKKEEIKVNVIAAIKEEVYSGQPSLFAENILKEAEEIYNTVVNEFKQQTIAIPRMVLQQGNDYPVFHDFDLDITSFHYQKLKEEILIYGITDKKVDTIEVTKSSTNKQPLEMLLAELNNFAEIDCETTDLQVKLCNQAIKAIEETLQSDADIRQVIKQWKKLIAEKIYMQMMISPAHFEIMQSEINKPKVFPFVKIEDWNFTMINNGYREYTDETMQPSQIQKYIFRDFKKTAHPEYKFQSRTEQTFAFILENDSDVMKWLRPSLYQFRIYWNNKGQTYQPDFIVETADFIYMIETKAANEIESEEVKAKAKKAINYCEYANEFIKEHGGKQWRYALIPHDKVAKNSSFNGIVFPNILNS